MVSFGNIIITFRNYVRIMLGSYVRLTLGSYVIKPCKWEVTSGLRYKNQVRITSVSNVRFTSGMGTKKFVIIT